MGWRPPGAHRSIRLRSRSTLPNEASMRDGFHIVASRVALLLTALGSAASPALAQDYGNPYGEWRYIWGDMASTRYSPLDQIDASNFETLETAWVWRGDN